MVLCMPAVRGWQPAYTADRVQDQGGYSCQLSSAPTLSTRLAGAWQELARSSARISAMHSNTNLSPLKYVAEWSENSPCWQCTCIFSGRLFLLVYVWKTSCWLCMRLTHCSITTEPQMQTDSYDLEPNHVSSCFLFSSWLYPPLSVCPAGGLTFQNRTPLPADFF